MSEDFWQTVGAIPSTREANVETWLVLPLLEALGYERSCIDSKVPVLFQEGRTLRPGRKPEADFVVYAEKPFCRATCLIVVETKRPDETLNEGREQGESYAQNLRAPVLLMTNGDRLEVWKIQVTTESVRVFDCKLTDLAARRGALESILSKEALKEHCRSIEYKNFDVLARDLGAYELAELDRIGATARFAMPRTLYADTTNRQHNWSDVLAMRGALLVGSSGYGKTMLAAALVKEGFERRAEGTARHLPCDVFLPDFALDGRSLEVFLTERIAAHKLGFTAAMLRLVARDQGLLLVADGFERVEPNYRKVIVGMLRTMMRDYPQTKLVLLSRANVAPTDLGLPILELRKFEPEDLRRLAEARATTHPNAVRAFTGAPDHIYRVGEVPLLADRLIDHYERERKHPSQLAPLYEAWLCSIFEGWRPVDQAMARVLLERLARETVQGPIAFAHAMEFGSDRSETKQIFDRLDEVDALAVRGSTVEVQHEALADYLRAIQFWGESLDTRIARLDKLVFDPASQFATLLIDTAPDSEARAKAWLAVANVDLRSAIGSLRLAAGDETFETASSGLQTQRFLGDIRNAIETLIEAHFPRIGHLLREDIAGANTINLGICGAVNANYVNYSFFDAREDEDIVQFGRREHALRLYGSSLQRQGYGPEAGRVIGSDRLRESLYTLLKARRLRGGRIWIEERTFGRLRHLANRYGTLTPEADLQEVHDVLLEQADAWVGGDAFSRNQEFPISELLDDIGWLIGQGITRLALWWEDPRTLDLHSPDGQRRFAHTISEYYQRVQLAYAEIVDQSFPSLRSQLWTLRMMPLRIEIEVEFHTRRGFEDVALNYRRWPVATYEESGADVHFPDVLTNHNNESAVQAYTEQTDVLLSSFGRSFSDRVITWGGTRVPDFWGESTTLDELPDESAVVRGAMIWLKRDLDDLFSEIQGR